MSGGSTAEMCEMVRSSRFCGDRAQTKEIPIHNPTFGKWIILVSNGAKIEWRRRAGDEKSGCGGLQPSELFSAAF